MLSATVSLETQSQSPLCLSRKPHGSHSLFPAALSLRVTSVWSPGLAARSLPSDVCSLLTSYTDADG